METGGITEQKSVVITKNTLINELVLNMDNEIPKEDVINLYNRLEKNLINHLSKANRNKKVTVKAFNGISFIAEFKPAEIRNNIEYKPDRITFKAKITTYLKRKLNGK